MVKKNIFVLLFFMCSLVPSVGNCQFYVQTDAYLKANSRWIFGSNVGYNKSGNTTFPVTGFSSFGATATVSDRNTGDLLFYLDEGKNCWNHLGILMPNGTNLGGGGRTQSVVVVPFIDDPKKYYVFTQQDPFSSQGSLLSPNARLYYSVIDMNLNGGLGDIVSATKKTLLDSAMSSSLIAIPGDNCDIWLIGHEQYHPIFKAWRITSSGINPVPVTSSAGPSPNPTAITTSYTWYEGFVQGQMTVSPDRNMIALATTSLNGISTGNTLGTLLCKFDATTGQVSNPIQINEGNRQHSFGVCFSPDNSKLYINVTSASNFPQGITQYIITNYDSTAIAQSKFQVYPASNTITWNYMKLYKDTIYISQQGMPTPTGLSTITNPNAAGAMCGYNFLNIFPGMTYQGLPNEVVMPPEPDTTFTLTLDTILCNTTAALVLQAPVGSTSSIWENGFTGPSRIVSEKDTYWVLSRIAGCHYQLDTFLIRGSDLKITLGNDTVVCNESSLELDPHSTVPVATTYLWDDNSQANTRIITETGTYWVTAHNNGCVLNDTIHVDMIRIRQDLGADNIACKDIPVDTTLKANVPDGADVIWSNGNNSNSIHITEPGIYSVRVSDKGCIGIDEIHIIRDLCDCKLLIPTAFTPNGDGLNDLFRPEVEPGCPIGSYMLQIFNRWGQRVFYSAKQDNGWNGQFKGRFCDPGTYFYTISMRKGTRDIEFEKKGDITLIR